MAAKSDIDPELNVRIEALIKQSAQLAGRWEPTDVAALYDEAELLAERAQTAGLRELPEALLGLSAYLSSFADSPLIPTENQLAQLKALADASADALERYRAHINVVVLAPGQQALSAQPAIHYLGRNPAHREFLQARFAQLGYALTVCNSAHSVETALDAGAVLALVIGTDALADWLTKHGHDGDGGGASARAPVAVISDRDLIDVRLAAMRCAAEVVFVLPEDADRVAPRMAGLIADRSEPYRVLIVDDDNSMRLFCDSVLRHNHMETHAVASPEEALEALHEFSPDVILADLYMPQISGFELLALFRAHPRTAFIPVVLLSGDSDAEKRFAALHIGGDDYLTKPIRPRHLVAAVTSRARRARWMRRELLAAR
ncbi:MAG TPA: response regulator [Rudaea sp.]|nr:response regulator [Rudaea sp.]